MSPQLTHDPAPPVRPVGPDQGVIEEARRRQRRRHVGVAIGGLLTAVLVAGLAWTIGGGGSNGARRPVGQGGRRAPTYAPGRRGQVSGIRGSAPLTGTVPSLPLLHYDVPVTPDLEAGKAGWCSDPRFAISGVPSPHVGGGTCAPPYRPNAPILLAGEEPISNAKGLLESSHTPLTDAQGNTNLFWAIVASRVAAVRLRAGYVVAARRDDRLAPGWSAVVAFVSGPLDPVALDSAGRVIAEPAIGSPSTLGPTTTRRYGASSSPTSSPCSIRAPHLPEVSASWGVLAEHVPDLGSAVAANTLFSCARSWYSVKGSTEAPSAAILVSAQQPQRPAPTPPGLRPTTRPGIFAEDGGGSGPLLAKRVGRAWLLVQGPSLSTDAILLSALHAEGAAVLPRAHR
jgi:hypothetical protein